MKVDPSKPFNPPLAPLAPRDLQNELYLLQTNMTTCETMIIKETWNNNLIKIII